jgi:hypothetical protein
MIAMLSALVSLVSFRFRSRASLATLHEGPWYGLNPDRLMPGAAVALGVVPTCVVWTARHYGPNTNSGHARLSVVPPVRKYGRKRCDIGDMYKLADSSRVSFSIVAPTF